MGTQQLLLVTLAVFVAVVLVGIGVAMFRDQGASQNRNSLTNDLVRFASQARKYHRRPAMLRSGNGSFGGMRMSELTSAPSNQNGTYMLVPDPVPPAEQSCTIIALGKKKGQKGSEPVKVIVKAWPDSMVMVVDNQVSFSTV